MHEKIFPSGPAFPALLRQLVFGWFIPADLHLPFH